MRIKDFFRPTVGKMVVLLLFVLASFIPSSITSFPSLQFDLITQLQLILLVPWFLLNLPSLSYLGIAIWLAYIYIIDCIYVGAYRYIERRFREEFPQINRRWKKSRKRKK